MEKTIYDLLALILPVIVVVVSSKFWATGFISFNNLLLEHRINKHKRKIKGLNYVLKYDPENETAKKMIREFENNTFDIIFGSKIDSKKELFLSKYHDKTSTKITLEKLLKMSRDLDVNREVFRNDHQLYLFVIFGIIGLCCFVSFSYHIYQDGGFSYLSTMFYLFSILTMSISIYGKIESNLRVKCNREFAVLKNEL